MTQLLEQDQDQVDKEVIERWRGCNDHSMNFELSSGLQDTLDTWCLSPRSRELDGGLIIRRDRAGAYELEPIVNPLSNIDRALIFDNAWPDVGAGPRRLQARSLDIIREHRVVDADVWLARTILEDPLPKDNQCPDLSEKQSMDFYKDVVLDQELNPWIEQEHRPSDVETYLHEAVFEDPSPPGSHSIGYHEEWSMNMNGRIVVRQQGSECIREQSRGSDMDIPFHETAHNVYSSSPIRFATKTYKAALSDMLQPSPDKHAPHLSEERGMDIYSDMVRKRRTSPWIKEDLRSSDMDIYFDEAVPEAYEYPSSPLKPDLQPNKVSLLYILQSPSAEAIGDRSPPSSPHKPRFASPGKNIDDHFGPVYFDEDMPEAYTPSRLMPSIGRHMTSLSYMLQSPSAEEISGRSPSPSPRKTKETSPDENVDGGGFSPGPFPIFPTDNSDRRLTESNILEEMPLEDASSTPQVTKCKRDRPTGTPNKKKTLSAAQSKKIAATALKRIDTLRKRTSTQAELRMTADPQEGNARKRRRKNRAEWKSDLQSEEQLRRGSGEFEKRINVLHRIAGDELRKGRRYGADEKDNQENWERIAYDSDL